MNQFNHRLNPNPTALDDAIAFATRKGHYYLCETSKRIILITNGDDKGWCDRCDKSHRPKEMTPATPADFIQQMRQDIRVARTK